jgi:long-chain acyl-CoA synthetase
MGPRYAPERVFHYLPFCFAGSWVLLLTCLSRNSVLTLSTDLTRLAEEIKMAEPHYFLNVPTLLERIRTAVQDQLNRRGGIALVIFQRAREAWLRHQAGETRGVDPVCLAVGNRVLFAAIRKRLGSNLKALICGSAPLAQETQLFFLMLGVPVLQVYGLTETTAICTMDDPQRIEPGRVGPAIPGIEMKLAEDNEILVRGPHIFPGYWNRPQETAQVFRDGWFRTGDQGEVNDAGNWRIIGRVKNLIILKSGHNIAPEPLEDTLLRSLAGAQQVVLVGNGRSFVSAIVTGEVTREQVQATLATLNSQLPHYKQIRALHVEKEPFTIENGLLTANGKLKRDAILARFQTQIEELYRKKGA